MVVIRTSLGSAAVCSVEVGDFVKYVSQLPSYRDLTNIRNILNSGWWRVSHQRPCFSIFQYFDLVFLKIGSPYIILPEKKLSLGHFFTILLLILSKNRRWWGERIQWNNNTASWLMGWYDNISNKNLLLLKQQNSHRLDRISRSCVLAFV